jgi:poly-gamma-glutamate capsule biosynthesis protein CapA/YwtB (metallophosphatase superfamily)
VRLALAGDTMLGRKVAEALASGPPESLLADEVVAVAREADLLLLNLECCISERGSPWPDPRKPFFFRAPPTAVDVLTRLGAVCVSLANNHALDFGPDALLDTLDHLDAAGIAYVGAGRDLDEARRPALLEAGGLRVAVVAFSDHPPEYAAGRGRPGIAVADLRDGLPAWIADAVREAAADAVVVSPHWGPNMTAGPVPQVRTAARELVAAGATLVAGHSAHVFHGVAGPVLYDLGDFLDDYRVDPVLRNDLGLLVIADLAAGALRGLEAVPLKLDFCRTRLAEGEDAAWIRERFGRTWGGS